MVAHCQCLMLADAGCGHYVRTVVDQPIYKRLLPSPPPPCRNTGWDRMACPSHQGAESAAMAADDSQETCGNSDWWGVTARAVRPSWTAPSCARPC